MLILESLGYQVEQIFLAHVSINVLQVELCRRQPLLWKFKRIDLNNGVSAVMYEYGQKDTYVNTSLFQYNIIVLSPFVGIYSLIIPTTYLDNWSKGPHSLYWQLMFKWPHSFLMTSTACATFLVLNGCTTSHYLSGLRWSCSIWKVKQYFNGPFSSQLSVSIFVLFYLDCNQS